MRLRRFDFFNTMRETELRLVTLGRLALAAVGRPPVAPERGQDEPLQALNSRRRKLALLAVLALSPRPVSRDALLAMFWPEQDEARARHALSDAISHLRRVLGRSALVSTRAELALAADAPLVVDVRELVAAAAAPSTRGHAIALYEAPFLDGVHVGGSAVFEAWVARERAHVERVVVGACAAECEALSACRDHGAHVAVASRWLEVDPLSVDAARHLLTALAAPATREGCARAVEAYERLRARLAREHDLRPDAAITRLAEELGRRASEPEPDVGTAPPSPPFPPRARTAAPRVVRPFVRAAVALAAVGLVALGLAARRAPRATPSTPVVAVVPIDVSDADTTLRWLSAGLPQLIAAKLSRARGMEVVPPAQVRAVLRRGELGSVPLTAGQLGDVGRAVGASFVVSGTVERGASGMVLDLAVHDAATGRLVRADVVADSGVIALADRATVRLLDVVGVRTSGPRLADLETSSVEAYQHFVRFNEIVYERADEASAELDAAIALDSGFTSAVLARLARAYADNDGAVIETLTAVLRRRAGRIPERDRLEWAARQAMLAGDVARGESAARLLVARYPRDPRGYEMLATILDNAGRWDAQARALEALLALDSLGIEAGRGPCLSCAAYSSLTEARLALGDWDGAERAARRWTVVAPEMHAAWTNLALLHAYRGRHELALAAMRRALSLAPDEPGVRMAWGWVLVMARRLDDADTAIARWRTSGVRALQVQAEDLASVVLRERGQFHASTALIARAEAAYPELAYLELVRANGLARAGDCAASIRAFERVHGPGPAAEPLPGGASRAFAWHHALLADAVADTPCARDDWLRALADSIERIGARSYFGRDWVLHHHVRGLVALRAGDQADAERQLRQARWRVADGWTSTSVALARAQLALGRPLDAVATLRDAYAIRPDAVGRYVPRSEIDHYMALAFRRAGVADSSAVYAAYVRRAWAHADAAVLALTAAR